MQLGDLACTRYIAHSMLFVLLIYALLHSKQQIGEALFVAVFLGIIGGIAMFFYSANVAEFLVGLPQGSVISADASAYIRCCTIDTPKPTFFFLKRLDQRLRGYCAGRQRSP